MKKAILYTSVLALALFAKQANAQNNVSDERHKAHGPHSFIGITGGLSAPQGNIAKGDYMDNNSGYFGTGGNIGLMGVYFINHSRFGISALISYQGFAFKGGQSLADGYKDGYSLDSTTLYGKGSNRAFNIMVGPYYSIAIAHHFSIDVRLLGGHTSVHRAGYQVAFEDADYDVTQLEETASAFGWQIGVAPRYNLGKHMGLMLNVDYFSANPSFNVEYTSFHPAENAEAPGINNQPINKTLPMSYHQPLKGINTNLTLYWRL